MHDAALVRVGERARDLHEDLADLGGGERAARREDGCERLAAQKLHDEVDHPAGLADPVDRDDAGVLELRRGAGLTLKPLDEFFVERERERQDLDGDLALQLFLARLEDDGHAAPTELVEDLVLVLELLPHELERSEEHTSELQSPCNLVCRIIRSEEHTSELQSPCNLVCRLLLEKKKNTILQIICPTMLGLVSQEPDTAIP